MIEKERAVLRGDPEGEAKAWLDKLAEADRMRRGYQEQAAQGYMTLDELGETLNDLEKTRETARLELAVLEGRRKRLEDLQQDANTLLESYAAMVPEALGALSPGKRHRVYKMLRLKVSARLDGALGVTGTFGEGISVGNSETLRLCRSRLSGRARTPPPEASS
jgi:chromosome segregation ATPase